jgi:hypothetical protein
MDGPPAPRHIDLAIAWHAVHHNVSKRRMHWFTAALCLLLLGFGVLFSVRIFQIFANGQVQLSDRIAIFSSSWLLFFVTSTWVMYKMSDVAAGYWALGILAFPLMVSLFYGADHRLSRTQFARRNTRVYMALMCLAGMVMYWPAMLLTVWLRVRLFA